MTETVNNVYRDYNTPSVPTSGDHKPVKSEIRTLLNGIEASVVTVAADAAVALAAETTSRIAADTALDDRLDDVEALALTGVKPAKQSVRVLADTNVTLATAAENGDTVDGVVLATGNRIAVVGQTAPAENGIYVVQASGAAVRGTDADTSSELLGTTFSVDAGTHAGEVWGLTNTTAITVGTTALTFVKQGAANTSAAEVIAGRAGEASLLARDDVRQSKRGTNLVKFPRLDGGPYNLNFINTTGVVQPAAEATTIASFLSRDLSYAVEFPAAVGGLFQYLPTAEEKPNLLGKYVCAWFIGHTTDTAPPGAVMRLVGGSDGGSIAITLLGGGGTLGRVEIDDDTWLFYIHGQMPSAGATYLATAADLTEIRWGYTSNPSATTFSVSEHGLAVRDNPWVVGDIPVLARSGRDKYTEEAKLTTLTLNGPAPAESVLAVRNGQHLIERKFRLPMSPSTVIAPPAGTPVFALSSDAVDGELFRAMTDDIAPAFLNKLGLSPSHVGGQHGFLGYLTPAPSHGKTSADVGQIVSNGGNQYGVIAVPDANAIVLARCGADVAAPTGAQTFTYVSGGSNTSNISSTDRTAQVFYPMTAEYQLTTSLGGRDFPGGVGIWEAPDGFGIREGYSVISRESAIDWFIANGSASVANINGDRLFSASQAYDFDKLGNMLLYNDLLPLQDLNARWIYGLQVQHSGATALYIPGVLPFTHDGIDYDFAMIDTAVAPTTQIEITPAMCIPTGPLADTFMTMNDDYIMAVGFLPVLDAEPAFRRSDMIPPDAVGGGSPRYNIALQGATTGKWYMRVFDRNYYFAGSGAPGSYAMAEGTLLGWAGYRIIVPRVEERTFSAAIPSKLGDFFRADWHNKQGIDRVPIPQQYAGRQFSVVYKTDNVSLPTNVAQGSIIADVDALGANAFMMLKFE